jgi:hypothetical protein
LFTLSFEHNHFILKAEARAEFAERAVMKLQKEVDRLEGKHLLKIFLQKSLIILLITDEWAHEKEKCKAISDEMDQTFAELTGY